jgi:hypothetical protein
MKKQFPTLNLLLPRLSVLESYTSGPEIEPEIRHTLTDEDKGIMFGLNFKL